MTVVRNVLAIIFAAIVVGVIGWTAYELFYAIYTRLGLHVILIWAFMCVSGGCFLHWLTSSTDRPAKGPSE